MSMNCGDCRCSKSSDASAEEKVLTRALGKGRLVSKLLSKGKTPAQNDMAEASEGKSKSKVKKGGVKKTGKWNEGESGVPKRRAPVPQSLNLNLHDAEPVPVPALGAKQSLNFEEYDEIVRIIDLQLRVHGGSMTDRAISVDEVSGRFVYMTKAERAAEKRREK